MIMINEDPSTWVKRLECSKDAKDENKRPKSLQLEGGPLKLASSLPPSMMMMMIRTNPMVCTLQISSIVIIIILIFIKII